MSLQKAYVIALLCLIVVDSYSQNKIVEFGEPTNAIGVKSVILKGKVFSSEGELLPGVSVQLQGTSTGVATDAEGEYEISIPPGIKNLSFSFVGMQSRVITFVIFRNATYDVVLQTDDVQLEQVTIEAEPDRNVSSVMPGVERVEISEIKQLPTLLGEVDVIRSLQLLPGVTSVGEGSGGFNVRGGKADQNLILFNNSQVFNASHILGFFSAFSPEVIEDFSLYKGFIPAQYGGRVSSVLEVDMKTGNSDRIQLAGSVGVIASSLTIDGPAWEGGTFLIGGRTSYSDWILSTVKDEDIRNSSVYFNDFNIGFRQRINDSNFIELSGYRSDDYFEFSDNFAFDWQNLALGFSWQSSLSENVVSDFSVNYNTYRSAQTDPTGADGTRRQIGINNQQLKEQLILSMINNHEITTGFEATVYEPVPETIDPAGPDSGVQPERIEQQAGREFSLFINDEIKFSERLKAAIGARYTFFNAVGPSEVYQYENDDRSSPFNIIDTISYVRGTSIRNYNGFEPRLSLRYKLGQASSIKASYGRFYQYIHTLSNTIAPSPNDLWILSGEYIRPVRSDNFSLGYYLNLSDNLWELSLDGFYRDLEDAIDFRDFGDIIANPAVETEVLQGKGQSYGLEVQVRKKENVKRWSGWLSYTYSRALIQVDDPNALNQINNGDWFAANYDRPHNLVLVSKYRLGKKSSFDATFTYISGRPVTAIESSYQINGFRVPNFSDRNKYRIPDYLRLDVGVTIAENIWKNRKEGYQFRRYKDKLTISFYNVLGRRNAYTVFFARPEDGGSLPEAYQFSILGNVIPAISYQFKY